MHKSPEPPAPTLRLSAILAQLCEAEEASAAAQTAEEQQSGESHASESNTPEASLGGKSHPEKQKSTRRRFRRTPRIPSHLTIGEIIDRTSHAGFGFLLGFLAVVSIPFFGVSTPFGFAIAFGAVQMIVGRDRPWLPRWIRRRRVSLKTLNWLSTRLSRRTAGLERVIRPRFTLLVRGPFWTLCGLAILIQGVGLALPLPIPGSNWIFILPVIGYAIGLLEDDGLLIMACHVATAGEIVLGFWAWDVIREAILAVWRWL